MTFNNRTAVVTGAAGRIGRALAEQFAANRVKLYLVDINIEALEPIAKNLRKTGADVQALYMDITDFDSIQKTSAQILADAGKVDILVNNAGCWPNGTALTTADKDWLHILNLNLNSVFRLSQIFGNEMKKNNYGRIINIGSIAGEVGLPELCAYSVAKAGVIMFTKTMAMETARYGVTVNCVSPGMITDQRTPNNGTWVGHSGLGEDVANAVVFLASDETGYITGVDFPVEGGRILGPLNPIFKN